MATGRTDTGVNVSGTEESAFFQQVAVNAEAVSNDWNFNTYALITVGYFITQAINASVGYDYQNGDLGAADGSGVLGRLAYEMTSGVTAGANISCVEAFGSRVFADLSVHFGGPSTAAAQSQAYRVLLTIHGSLACRFACDQLRSPTT